ncbi:MAG TPA: hypothetical protein VNH40_10385 [Gaiellaceae bacterium]|nr:hypothetical protein [Gaiellaceae bacterium]
MGLVLLGLGAVFFVVAAIDPPGADLGEDLRVGAVVDDLGGGFVLTGYALALLLVSLLLLGAADSLRSGRLLTRLGIAAMPFMGALTVLNVLFDRGEWQSSNVGPFMGSLVFFTLPALLTGALLAARP